MGCVIPISCPDVVGIGSAVSVDVIAMSGKETSATVIGHIRVYNVHFCDNQQCSTQAAQDNDTNLVFLQVIVCSAIIKRIVFNRLTASEIIHAVFNGHLAVLAIIQASPLDIVLRAVHEPQELILLHLNGIEPTGDKLIEITGFVFTEHKMFSRRILTDFNLIIVRIAGFLIVPKKGSGIWHNPNMGTVFISIP